MEPSGQADTIFAVATAPGKAALAILRISGPDAIAAVEGMVGGSLPPRRLVRRRLSDPRSGEALDDGMVVVFPAPASATGEDVGELHLHGGRAVVAAVMRALGHMEGLRPAEPGEYARRAFLNGKLDLSQAEALADLIDAETDGQRRQALRGLDGGIGARAEDWRRRILQAQGLAEAAIDFADEGDVADGIPATVMGEAASIAAEIEAVLTDGRAGERMRNGVTVVIAGPPNAGKSTLFNLLARRDVAIVSPHPGTTRDVLEVRLDLGGLPLTLIDTAGLRASTDAVEIEGVRRARDQMASADLVLLLRPVDSDMEWLGLADDGGSSVVVEVDSKSDLLDPSLKPCLGRIGISAATGAGIDELTALLMGRAAAILEAGGIQDAIVTRERHRRALEDALRGLRSVAVAPGDELRAEALRLAARAVGRIAGRIDVEDVLGEIFMRFCIGK